MCEQHLEDGIVVRMLVLMHEGVDLIVQPISRDDEVPANQANQSSLHNAYRYRCSTRALAGWPARLGPRWPGRGSPSARLLWVTLRSVAAGMYDALRGVVGWSPSTPPIFGEPGHVAAFTDPDSGRHRVLFEKAGVRVGVTPAQ